MKKIKLLALVLSLLLMLCSCTTNGGTGETYNTALTATEIVQVLLNELSFSADMSLNTQGYTAALYGVETYEDAAGAGASGTVADAIAVFVMVDHAQAESLKKDLAAYVEDTTAEYEKYAPEEVSKLNKAFITVYDNRVVLCIGAEESAVKTVMADIFSGKHTAPTTTTTTTTTTTEPTITTTESTATETTTTTTTATTTVTTTSTTFIPTDENPYPIITPNGDFQKYGVVVRSGDAGYECYYYNKSYAAEYAKKINDFALGLPETNNVYVMVIPNSMAITLPDELFDKVNSTNQNTSIEKVYAQMNERVNCVRLYDTLMLHRKEYVYFRTDHHWTALGAYYGFSCFAQQKGFEIAPIADYQSVTFDNFLGSFYRDCDKNETMGNNPDSVIAYYPRSGKSVKMTYRTTKGKDVVWPIINDVSKYKSDSKYLTFAGGDNPYTLIENKDLTDGSVCIVIKESYGNALVPFLADHYQTIYELDYRYYKDSFSKLVKENPNADILFADNISMLQSKYLKGKFATFMVS